MTTAGGQRLRQIQWHFEVLTPPDGEAPLAIREQWVGTQFPIASRNMDGPQPELAAGIVTGSLVEMSDAVYVHLPDAIAALRAAGRTSAAEWWTAWWEAQGRPCDGLQFERACGRIFYASEL
jgi:hypothetical protein